MKKNFISLLTVCALAGTVFAGCNNAAVDDPLLSGNNAGINSGNNAGDNSSVSTDDPAGLINAAYEKNLAATSCTITFSTGNTFEGDEEEQAGTEFDFDKFVITSDAIAYETGEVWITLDGETVETRVDDKSYIAGVDEYHLYDADRDDSYMYYYIYEEDVDAKEYIKTTAKLPIDTYKDAFDALAALDLTAAKSDDGNVVIKAEDLDINDFGSILSNLINTTPESVEYRFGTCTEFGVEVTIDKDGYATSVIITAKDMPRFMTEDNDEFLDYTFKLEMTDINTATVTKPDFVENYVLGTTDVIYVTEGWELEYRYNWNETNEYSFFARANDEGPSTNMQYEVLTEIAGIRVDVLGASLSDSEFDVIVPKDMVIDLSYSKFSTIYCNNTREDAINLYLGSPYGKWSDAEQVETDLNNINIFFAGEWSYVDGVATPN